MRTYFITETSVLASHLGNFNRPTKSYFTTKSASTQHMLMPSCSQFLTSCTSSYIKENHLVSWIFSNRACKHVCHSFICQTCNWSPSAITVDCDSPLISAGITALDFLQSLHSHEWPVLVLGDTGGLITPSVTCHVCIPVLCLVPM